MTHRNTVIPFPFLDGRESDARQELLKWNKFLFQDSGFKKNHDTHSLSYGLERCLYELNQDLVCQSPFLLHAKVLTSTQALLALEEVAEQPNRPNYPVDRHLVAFLMSRWKEMNFVDMQEVIKPQREIRNLAVLRILAGIQQSDQVGVLPHLCQWIADICSAMVTKYHNIKVKKEMKKAVSHAVKSGHLAELLCVLDNRQSLSDDESDYCVARIEVLLIESEIKEIERRILNRNRAPQGSSMGFGMLWFPMTWLKNQMIKLKSRKKITKLHRQSESLREIWGEDLWDEKDARHSLMYHGLRYDS